MPTRPAFSPLLHSPASIFVLILAASLAAGQKPKLPRPRILEKEVPLSRVALVEVQCTVTAPDGTRVRGLTRDDFRVWEDGVEQMVNSFDAASTPASIALIIDASPSIYRELGTMRGV